MRELTDRIFDSVRSQFPGLPANLKADAVELPELGHLFHWDLGDDRGRLVAEPQYHSLVAWAGEFEFALSDDEALARAVESGVIHLRYSLPSATDVSRQNMPDGPDRAS